MDNAVQTVKYRESIRDYIAKSVWKQEPRYHGADLYEEFAVLKKGKRSYPTMIL